MGCEMGARTVENGGNDVSLFEIGEAGLDAGDRLRIGPMQANHAGELATVLAGIDPWARLGTDAADLERFIATVEPMAPRYLLQADGRKVGAAVVRRNWLRGPYLQFLAILPEYQGRNFGRQFMSCFEIAAERDMARHAWLMVSAFNAPAQGFYRQCGYEDVARIADVVKDGCSEILMRKRIAPPEPPCPGSS